MDAIVQLARNALCCIKDLNLFADYGIHEPAGLPLPAPLNKTSALEVLIGFSQFYAFVSVSMSGMNLMISDGFKKLHTIRKIQEKGTNIGEETAQQLLVERLRKEETAAKKNIFVGLNVFCIGFAFLWLCGNSFHVTETTWIGGLPALIHALTVMEICLVPLLYYMLDDVVKLIGRAAIMEYLVKVLGKCTDRVPSAILTEETFGVLLDKGWTPFWAGKSGLDDAEEEKEMSNEVANLLSELEAWTKDKDNKVMKSTIHETAARLSADAVTTRYEAYREFLYFILNFVAFYGYLLGIIVYYANEDEPQSVYVRTLKLGMNNSDADWSGNFAGDLMWTIEPIVILGSPALFTWLKPKAKKVKLD